MKKIFVFSDTHGSTNGCMRVIGDAKNAAAIIHAGDCVRDADDLNSIFPDIPMYNVRGNCDFLSNDVNDRIEIIDGVKIFITHGHSYNVKNTLSELKRKGHEINADVVVFGHTHVPTVDIDGGMIILNPGSSSGGGTYAVITIDNKKARADIFNM